MVYTTPGWAKDQILNRVDIFLSFKDRLKVLLGAPLWIDVYNSTENPVGKVEGKSKAYVGRLIKLKKGMDTYSTGGSDVD